MTNEPIGYVSAIGTHLIESILELIEQLEAHPNNPPNEVQTNPRENGLSCAIIALSVFVLESAVNRTKYIRQDDPRDDLKHYLSNLMSDSDLVNDIDEIIAARDAVVHNHLWEAKVAWDESLTLTFVDEPVLLKGYGNDRLTRVMNTKTRQSKRLGLNLFPPRIWRVDAYRVFQVVGRGLSSLESIDRRYVYVSHQPFTYQRRLQTFSTILESIGGRIDNEGKGNMKKQ